MGLNNEVATRFVCQKCEAQGAEVKRIATTGTGISKLMNWQSNTFIAASCKNCGYTEMYNPEMLERRRHGMDILDALFGS